MPQLELTKGTPFHDAFMRCLETGTPYTSGSISGINRYTANVYIVRARDQEDSTLFTYMVSNERSALSSEEYRELNKLIEPPHDVLSGSRLRRWLSALRERWL